MRDATPGSSKGNVAFTSLGVIDSATVNVNAVSETRMLRA